MNTLNQASKVSGLKKGRSHHSIRPRVMAKTLGHAVTNNVEDSSAGVPNDLAAIVGAYVRGE